MRQFCRNEPNRDQWLNGNGPQQNQNGQIKTKIKEKIEDLLLKVRPIKMPRRKSSIIFVGSIVLPVNVGRKIRVKVVVIVEVHILLTNVVTLIRSLVCQIL